MAPFEMALAETNIGKNPAECSTFGVPENVVLPVRGLPPLDPRFVGDRTVEHQFAQETMLVYPSTLLTGEV